MTDPVTDPPGQSRFTEPGPVPDNTEHRRLEEWAVHRTTDGRVDYVYEIGRLLVRAQDLLAVQHALDVLGVAHRFSNTRVPDLMAGVVDAAVPELLVSLENVGIGAEVSPNHVATLPAGPTPATSPQQQPDRVPRRSGMQLAGVTATGSGKHPPQRVVVLGSRSAGANASLASEPGSSQSFDPSNPDPEADQVGPESSTDILIGLIRQAAPSAVVDGIGVFNDSLVDEVTLTEVIADLRADPTVGLVVIPGGWYARGDRMPLSLTPTGGAEKSGVLVLCAAGDDETSRPCWPSALDSVVSVAALGSDGSRPTDTSNYGESVDVWAVGEGLATSIGRTAGDPDPNADQPGQLSGTSVAAAVVAGRVAAQMVATRVAARQAFDHVLRQSDKVVGLGIRVDVSPHLATISFGEPSLGFRLDAQDVPRTGESAADVASATRERDAGSERVVHPRFEAPDQVVADEEFAVVLGLGEEATPGVAGGAFGIPTGPLDLDVHLIADEFSLRHGESWRNTLRVDRSEPAPFVVLHLTPAAQRIPFRAAQLQLTYGIGGRTISWASRVIAVVRDSEFIGRFGLEPEEPSARITVTGREPEADLTVNIMMGSEPGRLLWTFDSPHIRVPLDAAAVNIGSDPAAYSRNLIMQVKAHVYEADLLPYLRGVGDEIAELMPTAFPAILRETAERSDGRPPTVLLQSEDPFVPWELALIDPPLDQSALPFLNCQAIVGRWAVTRSRMDELPPPDSARAEEISVISGLYEGSMWAPLPGAQEEARILESSYHAVRVNAELQDVLTCLRRRPSPDVLHFAGHGSSDPLGLENGFVLVDGRTLDPRVVRGIPLDGKPVVFLNACQVGGGQQALGGYAGMAKAFLRSGATAVIAPLWDVDDQVAYATVAEFYRRCLVRGERPASVMRDLRMSAAHSGAGAPFATALAYQFFGHPNLQLKHRATGGPDTPIPASTPARE